MINKNNNMKLKATILLNDATGTYFGHLDHYPAVCAQSDSMDSLVAKLKRYFNIYTDYIKNEVEIDTNLISM